MLGDYQKNDSVQMRLRITTSAGYALLLFACQMTVWGGLQLSVRTGFELLPLLTWWSVPLSAAIGVVLLALGALVLRFYSGTDARFRFDVSRKRAFASGVSLAAGVLVLFGYAFVAFVSPSSAASVCVGATALGLGMGLLLGMWVAVFGRFQSRDITSLALLSVIVSSVLCLIFIRSSLVVSETAFVLAVIGSAVLLAIVFRAYEETPRPMKSPEDGQAEEGLTEESPGEVPSQTIGKLVREVLRAVRNPLFCAASIAFAVAITRTMTLNTASGLSGAVSMWGTVVTVLFAAVMLGVARRRGAERFSHLNVPALFRALFPLVATLLLTLSIGGEAFELPVGAAVFAIYTIMSVLMIPVCVDNARRKGLHPITTYGLFSGLVYVVFTASTLLGTHLFKGDGGFGATTSLVATLLTFYVLSMAFALVQRRTTDDDSVSGDALGEGATNTSTAERNSDEGDKSVVPEGDPVERRCNALSEQHGLTPREAEVLVAFARGRDVNYLAEQLCLSTNTIRTHSKTLYTKLGVHSKQELIDLVDAALETAGTEGQR